jgi:hypothetical protein
MTEFSNMAPLHRLTVVAASWAALLLGVAHASPYVNSRPDLAPTTLQSRGFDLQDCSQRMQAANPWIPVRTLSIAVGDRRKRCRGQKEGHVGGRKSRVQERDVGEEGLYGFTLYVFTARCLIGRGTTIL